MPIPLAKALTRSARTRGSVFVASMTLVLCRHGDQPHPPLLLVFNRIGPRNPNTVITQLAELTERHWKGTAYDGGFHMYDGTLPIVVTGMKQLQEHGPAGAVFRRFGRPQNQTLLGATRAAKPTTPAGRPSTPPASGSTRRSCAASPRSTRPSARPAARCAPAAAPGSPTNGGRPSSPPGGAPHATPTCTCATAASSAPSLPNTKSSRPGPSTRSTTKLCPSRRPAAHGSPASAHDPGADAARWFWTTALSVLSATMAVRCAQVDRD
ncbi:hypothetical protein HEP81_08033 (plasmid) [Streptomyces griseofuscus]|uniref:Uncharacterized protein n=1 Tax=Streptomyces griseofuscus TaxID=146922 RepID=A0A7H1QD81_9ACTN|nr:hypothetical protein HEP81_08033 [Streptomyces griseofuscus]